jgi:hypothetical protein
MWQAIPPGSASMEREKRRRGTPGRGKWRAINIEEEENCIAIKQKRRILRLSFGSITDEQSSRAPHYCFLLFPLIE